MNATRGDVRTRRPAMAAALPGFESINRYWDPHGKVFAAKILPGEYYVTQLSEMVTTVLGSCIAACIRDKLLGIGGMNHFMLPEHVGEQHSSWESTKANSSNRYGAYAMEHLINDILKAGGRRENLEVKIFGGGQVLNIESDVGRRNAEFAKAYLRREGLRVCAMDVEGPHPRKVNYFPESGRAMVKKLVVKKNNTVIERETNYLKTLLRKPVETEIDLF